MTSDNHEEHMKLYSETHSHKYNWGAMVMSIEIDKASFLKTFGVCDEDILEHGDEIVDQLIGGSLCP